MEEIEINFRLDPNGRTALDTDNDPTLDYAPKTIQTSLSSNNNDESLLDDLLFDAEIADSGLMPRTFWMPSSDVSPRCSMEQMALDVFHHHTQGLSYDPERSGAEWWVQLRPSPEAGRYSMHAKDDAENGISFHWDKDEELRILCGGNTYIHPHLSTVTYLTDFGAPTMAMSVRINNFTGAYIQESETEAFISWPKSLKHLSFDGRFLHAAPHDLMEPGAFRDQISFETPSDPKQAKLLMRRHRRVTFLVNIWLNYKPLQVDLFPETMIDKMSGRSQPTKLVFSKNSNKKDAWIKTESTQEHYIWPMGDESSKEYLSARVPIDKVREKKEGGDIRLLWDSKDSFQLPFFKPQTVNDDRIESSKRQKTE